MEIKDLSREIVLTEMLSERGKMVLELHQTVVNLQRENAALKGQNEELVKKVQELEGMV